MTDGMRSLFQDVDLGVLSFAELDVCGVESCQGDPWSLVCTLSVKHDGMHHQDGVNCSWAMGWDALRVDAIQ